MEIQRKPSTRPSSAMEFINESGSSVFDEIPMIEGYVKKICNKYRKKDCQTHVKITKSMDDLSNYDQIVPAESAHFKEQDDTEHRKSEEYLLEITNNPVDEIGQEMQEEYSEAESKPIVIKIIVTKESSKRDNENSENSCISDDKKLAKQKVYVKVIFETPNENTEYYAKVCTSENIHEEVEWVTPKKFESIQYSLTSKTDGSDTKSALTTGSKKFPGNQALTNSIVQNDFEHKVVESPINGDSLTGLQKVNGKPGILKTNPVNKPKEVDHSSAKEEAINDLLREKQKPPSILKRTVQSGNENNKKPDLPQKPAYTDSISKGAIPKQLTTKKRKTVSYSPTNEEYYEDCLIIRDIVMERFQKALNESNLRRTTRQLSRRNSSLSDDSKMEEHTNSPEYVNVQFRHDKKLQSPKGVSFDSGIQVPTTPEMQKSNSFGRYSEEGKETVEYDSSEFLRAALGDELLDQTSVSQANEVTVNASSTPFRSQKGPIQGSERSIGSSDISTLVSNVDQTFYSLYSTIKKPINKTSVTEKKSTVSRPLFKAFSPNNSYEYASVRKIRISHDMDKLTKEMSDLENTIYQVTKALSICRNNPKFFGEIPHIEAEKMLLLATYKKKILNTEINTSDYQEIELSQYFGIMRMENLKFSTESKAAQRKNVTQYYLCILQSGVTVLASDISTPDANGLVTFTKQFEFKKLVLGFKILLSIYGMDIENNEINTSSCLKRKGSLRKNKKTFDNDPTYIETSSLFQLLGKCKIGKCEVVQGHNLKLDYMSPGAPLSESFVADFRGSVEIKGRSVGFLNITTRCLLWDKRWCVLDGSRLKYWNYPADEFVKKPIGIIDLMNCSTHEVTSVDKSICSRPRTCELKINNEGKIPSQEVYLLSADNSMEFNEWKRQINMRLAVIKCWTDLSSQAVHTDV